MNEEQKNIETCLAENILSEVASVPTDPQFVSLTDEALDPLKQQALQQAGYDGYKEVVWTHKPYTFTSSVKQMKSNLILLLRSLWRFPFGRGTTAASAAGSASASAAAPIRSLADMWQHYITRLKGNPEYGIPSRLSSLTDLPSVPALLADRKIGGVPEAADGMSLVQLLCADYNGVTELEDDTNWESGKNINTLVSLFPNLAKVVWGAHSHTGSLVTNVTGLTELELPNLRTVSMVNGNTLIQNIGIEELTLHITSYQNYYAGCVMGCTNLRKLTFDELESIRLTNDNDNRMIGDCSALEEIYAEKLGNVYVYRSTDNPRNGFVSNCAALKKLCFGDVTAWSYRGIDRETGAPNLIDLRFKSVSCSLDLGYWNPTNALDASMTDLIEEGSTATNNLQQFLSNFKTYIAERLTDKGSGLTLTLSQAVRDAIEGDPTIAQIITSKGWTISPAPTA